MFLVISKYLVQRGFFFFSFYTLLWFVTAMPCSPTIQAAPHRNDTTRYLDPWQTHVKNMPSYFSESPPSQMQNAVAAMMTPMASWTNTHKNCQKFLQGQFRTQMFIRIHHRIVFYFLFFIGVREIDRCHFCSKFR